MKQLCKRRRKIKYWMKSLFCNWSKQSEKWKSSKSLSSWSISSCWKSEISWITRIRRKGMSSNFWSRSSEVWEVRLQILWTRIAAWMTIWVWIRSYKRVKSHLGRRLNYVVSCSRCFRRRSSNEMRREKILELLCMILSVN